MISSDFTDMSAAGLTYDQWMNVSGVLGVVLLFATFFFVLRGWAEAQSEAIRLGRRVGYVFIGIPLFSRWFLSESLLLSIGVCLVVVASCKLLLLRKGV